MTKLRIIFLCSSRFALNTLKELAFFQMLVVVAIPRHCDEMLEEVEGTLPGTGIPVLALDKEKYTHQLQEAIEKYNPDLGLMMTFSYKIPSSVYNIPSLGFYNVHPGPLPQYRGADPVFHQIKNREKLAGVTIHKVNDGIDTGPVVICEMIKLEASDTYGSLNSKLSVVAAKLVGILIKMATLKFSIPSKPQDETKAKYHKRQQANDIIINWDTMDADTIIALINAGNPWNKGAVTKMNNQVVRLVEAGKLSRSGTIANSDGGTIVSVDESELIVSTMNNELLSLKILYTDEGFFSGSSASKRGFKKGLKYENF